MADVVWDGMAAAAAEPVVVVRYGEVGLKGENRPVFEKLLARQVERALAGVPSARVERSHGRLFAVGVNGRAEVLERLQRVFGVVSVSPALRVAAALPAIEEAARRLVAEELERRPGVRTFKVAARRSEKRFPMDSPSLNRHLGAVLLRAFPSLSVDVHHPDLTVAVEVRERAYVSCATLPGPGGLPLGASGRAHLLLSGGIDSPVAGWLAMKRGLEVEAVHFHSFPFTSERSLEKVVDLCRVLARYAGVMTLHVVPFTAIQRAIYAEVPPALGITVMRRMMFRLAEAIARQRRGEALVTGESLGQVASQTLASIAVIGAVVELPILRPLIAFDKVEITDWARRIDTYPISIRPYEDCCTVFVPRHPSTRPRLEAVAAAEARLDVAALTAEALAGVETSEVTA